MIKLLLDANISPQTAAHLNQLPVDTKSITAENLGHLTDTEIVQLANREHRIIVTFDLDFGEIYYNREQGKIGVIVVRLKDQTVESINKVLSNFLKQYQQHLLKQSNSLIIIKPNSIRFIK